MEAAWQLKNGDLVSGHAWAASAVAVFDRLAADVSGFSFDVTSMRIRMQVMRACGVRPGDPVLDPDVIFAWVRAALVVPADEAVRRSALVRSALADGGPALIDEARKLRRIRHRLSILAELSELVAIDADLASWLRVREQLL